MEQEPIAPDAPLLNMDNVLLSPHSGPNRGGAQKTQIEMMRRPIPAAGVNGAVPARNVANHGILRKETAYRFA